MSYQFDKPFNNEPPPISSEKLQTAFAENMTRVYGMMTVGLLLTAIMAGFVSTSETILQLVFGNQIVFFGLIIGELLLVMAISAAISRISTVTGTFLFFLYSAMNGVTLSVILLVYTGSSIAMTFGATASLFAVMSVIGLTTKQDLTSMGRILLMGLIGLIIASIANFFIASTALEWILSYVGVGLFLGLTVYDSQRIKVNTQHALMSGDEQMMKRVAIMGALHLYLDFINLFLFLLRIFGRRR